VKEKGIRNLPAPVTSGGVGVFCLERWWV